MKTIKIVVLILLLIFIPYFIYNKYIQHKRFNPPSAYDYVLNNEVDVHYYDPEIVQKYYENAAKVGNLARNYWYEIQVDVRAMNPNDPKYAPFISEYQQAQATTKYLEQRLLLSTKLKKMGLTNADIREIEVFGLDDANLPISVGRQMAKNWTGGTLKQGDDNADVYMIQQYLKDLGYEIKVDGFYESITKAAVTKFQNDRQIFANGIINDLTCGLILAEKWKK